MSANNGYDAMRVALYLAWHGAADHPAIARQAAAYRDAAEVGANAAWTPTVIEPASMRVTERSPHAGYAALRGLILCLQGEAIGSTIPPFTTQQPYYPATLHLLALVAQAERYPRCVPI
jgi:endoglucanase